MSTLKGVVQDPNSWMERFKSLIPRNPGRGLGTNFLGDLGTGKDVVTKTASKNIFSKANAPKTAGAASALQ